MNGERNEEIGGQTMPVTPGTSISGGVLDWVAGRATASLSGRVVLKDGDVITIGRTVLRFRQR